MAKPTRRAALMRIIRFDEKKVMINQNGSFKWYARIKRWMPKNKKKQRAKVSMICLIHQKMCIMGI
jgi:hypothetical protein